VHDYGLNNFKGTLNMQNLTVEFCGQNILSVLWFYTSISVRKVMQKYGLTFKHGINLITFCQLYNHPQHLTMDSFTIS